MRTEHIFPIPSGRIRYELETEESGLLTHVNATVRVDDDGSWPIVRSSTSPGVALDVILETPLLEEIQADLRSAEGLLSLFGLDSIDMRHPEATWLPDSPGERERLQFFAYSVEQVPTSIEEAPVVPFDLIARSFLAARGARELEVALSFFRRGRVDVMESRYIEAAFNFLFMIETLFAKGKFRSAEVERIYLGDARLIAYVQRALTDPDLLPVLRRDRRIWDAYVRDHDGRSVPDFIRYLVNLRGFLHHHSKERPGIWHPEEHVRFGADALLLQQVGFEVASAISEAHVHSQTVVSEYTRVATEYLRSKRA